MTGKQPGTTPMGKVMNQMPSNITELIRDAALGNSQTRHFFCWKL